MRRQRRVNRPKSRNQDRKNRTHLKGPGLVAWRRAPRAASRRGSRRLSDRWAEILPRLHRAKHIVLLLDFDGTLAAIQARPEMVRLGAPTRRVIARLARHPRITVWMVSGRRLRDLRRRARVKGVRYVGLHGAEWEDRRLASPENKFLREARRLLMERVAGLPGIRLEDKRVSLAVHYRGAVAPDVRRARSLLRKLLKPFGSHLRMMEGKKVWEVLPPEMEGKGRAVRMILEEFPEGTLPVYIGDDTTDESAFSAIPGGISIHVGRRRRTKARYTLRDPQEVIGFLRRLEREFQ